MDVLLGNDCGAGAFGLCNTCIRPMIKFLLAAPPNALSMRVHGVISPHATNKGMSSAPGHHHLRLL